MLNDNEPSTAPRMTAVLARDQRTMARGMAAVARFSRTPAARRVLDKAV